MYINNIDIGIYGASVSKKIIKPSKILVEKQKNKLLTVQTNNEVELKSMTVKILFEGKNRDEIKDNISNFMINLINEVDIKFKNLSNKFHSYLVSDDIEDTEFDEWMYLNLEFDCYEYGDEVTETINRITNKTINVAGNLEIPAIVEITPSIELIDLTLTGLDDSPIILKNLKANKKIIVNGEEGKVIVDGVNKYGDTDMWGFPKLKPGANTIIVDKSSVDITIKYKPRYI